METMKSIIDSLQNSKYFTKKKKIAEYITLTSPVRLDVKLDFDLPSPVRASPVRIWGFWV